MKRLLSMMLVLLLLSGCSGESRDVTPRDKGVPAMNVTSTAFQEGTTIPKQCTGEGKDVSPPLKWSEVPAGTKSFAVICDDPDAPRKEPWVHWVLFNLPAETRELAEGASRAGLPAGAKEGKNDFGNIGYGGPMPPPGKPHRYYFKVYALDTVLDLQEGATKAELERAMKGHVLAEGQLMGKYAR